jgi:hypothetical protein
MIRQGNVHSQKSKHVGFPELQENVYIIWNDVVSPKNFVCSLINLYGILGISHNKVGKQLCFTEILEHCVSHYLWMEIRISDPGEK